MSMVTTFHLFSSVGFDSIEMRRLKESSVEIYIKDQSGIKCGVSSHRKFAFFLAHNAESRFLRQKVLYFNVSRQKVSYSSVSRQNIVKHCFTMLL